MKSRVFIIIAAVLMLLAGVLRGTGGVLLLLNGNNIDVDPPITASSTVARICGLDLIFIYNNFLTSAVHLFKNKKIGWVLSWFGLIYFIIGGLVNGYLLFNTPFVQDQIINYSASAVIAAFLVLGRKSFPTV